MFRSLRRPDSQPDRRSSSQPLRVIIFFGHHKVGSSALQTHLARVAPAALRAGVLFPVVTVRDLKALEKQVRRGKPEQKLSRNVTEAHNALAFSMIHDRSGAAIPALHGDLPPTNDMFALIRRQIDLFAPHTLVLASEVFANFAQSKPVLIDDLMDGLGVDRNSARIELFAYLRRVDDYLASWHAQRVRLGQKVRPLPDALTHYRKNVHFDYRLMIEAWADKLPGSRLVLRPYDATVRKTGSMQVFAETLGVDLPDLPEGGAHKVNLSLHRALLDIARRANFDLPSKEAKKMFQALLKLGPELDLPGSTEVELWGSTARGQLARQFAPIHDWLSGLVGHPFFDDAEKIGQRVAVDEFDANIAALVAIRKSHMRAFSRAGASFIESFEPERHFPAQSVSGAAD